MPFRVYAGSILGIDAHPIEVEADATTGLPFFTIVGLPDKTVEESKDRIASAIRNSGFIPLTQTHKRIIVNLAPAHIKKEGPAFDLSIALAYLLCTNQITFHTEHQVFLGELSLDGSLRSIRGTLAYAKMAKQLGFTTLYVPYENAHEGALIQGLTIYAPKNLTELTAHLRGENPLSPIPHEGFSSSSVRDSAQHPDMRDVKGQEHAKRALMIAASGNHNVLMSGPPGSGKSLLAHALVGILPDLDLDQALEVTQIHSIAGLLDGISLIKERPFRTPHHTASSIALIGGGSVPRPGEISLAHHGVLFLDELPEFSRHTIEALRQPLENYQVMISRAAHSLTFPSRFMLVAAMNPCPCGQYGNDLAQCSCSVQSIFRYQKKISGPLLDRIDIHVTVSQERYEKLSSVNDSASSAEIRTKVNALRALQKSRFSKHSSITANAHMGPKEITEYCKLTTDAEAIMHRAMDAYNLSGRGYHKVLKVARTIADLANHTGIEASDIAEALSYRIKTNN